MPLEAKPDRGEPATARSRSRQCSPKRPKPPHAPKTPSLGARYHAIQGRRGTFEALGAIRHDILIAYWHIVTADVGYQDLGVDWLARRHSREHQIAQLAKQIEKLGAAVEITMPAA